MCLRSITMRLCSKAHLMQFEVHFGHTYLEGMPLSMMMSTPWHCMQGCDFLLQTLCPWHNMDICINNRQGSGGNRTP